MRSPVVLITGALTGIGRAAAFIFAQDGAQVVVAGRRDDQGQALVAELLELGADAMFVHADVRHEEEVRNLVDETVRRFGAWILPSITRRRKDCAVSSQNRPRRAMQRRSTATYLVCC
jgi:NAD(P)-dependent dehydrogenase (short-subunit alcohol dehydrogenase family)